MRTGREQKRSRTVVAHMVIRHIAPSYDHPVGGEGAFMTEHGHLSLRWTNDGPGIARDVRISNISVSNGPKALTEAMQRFLMEVLFINNGITYLAKPHYVSEPILNVDLTDGEYR